MLTFQCLIFEKRLNRDMAKHHRKEFLRVLSKELQYHTVEYYIQHSCLRHFLTEIFLRRLLLAKESNPERWASELAPMETHTTERQSRPTWAADQVSQLQHISRWTSPVGDRPLPSNQYAKLIRWQC